jgi:hypothetical protein
MKSEKGNETPLQSSATTDKDPVRAAEAAFGESKYLSGPNHTPSSIDNTLGRAPTSFVLEYPKKAAVAIHDNREYLQKLIPAFGWMIQITAGYNVLPNNYRCFDEKQAAHFSGKSSLLIRNNLT